MRIIAPMMILIMMTSTLAGCTGGDPDGGGNDNIDMDVLNSMIDDNLQDFINNTTITVENHYHNNTTYVTNEYNNISNNEGDSVTENNFQTDYTNYSLGGIGNNSGSSDEIIFVMHLEFNASEIAPELVPRINDEPSLRTFNYTKSFYGFVWFEDESNGSNGWFEEQLINTTHIVSCSIYYQFEGTSYYNLDDWGDLYFQGDGTFWENNEGEYDTYWAYLYGWNSSDETSQMTPSDYYSAGELNENFCHPEWNPWVANVYSVNIGNIMVPYGYLISGTVIEYQHELEEGNNNGTVSNSSFSAPNSYYDSVIFVRESGMSTTSSIGQYGGWDNLTLMIDLNVYYLYENSDFTLTIIYTFTPVISVS